MALRTPLMGLFDVLDDEEASLSAVKAEIDDQQRRLNPLAMDKTQPLAIKWTALQAKFEYNLPVRLLEWLRRILSLSANSRVLDRPTSACIGAAIRLMQTCLLLHPRSNVLFARPAAWTTVLRLLERSVTASSAADRLTLAVLELILFALIDRPKNMRQFEASSCLARVVTCFKDKTASHAVRLKSLEILYYYMLPETAASPLTSYAGSEGWSRADYPPSPAASSAGSQGTPFFPSASDMSRIRLEVLETPQKPRMSQAPSSGETPRSSSHFARSPSSCSLAATPAHEATRREQSDSRSQSRLSMSDIPRTPRRSMLSPQADQTPTKSGGGGLTRSDSQRALASITNAASALASRMSLSASKQDRRRNSIDFSTRTRPNVSERGSSFDLDRPNRASDQNMPPPSLPQPAPSGLVRSRSTLLSPLSSSSSHQHAHRRSRSSFVMSDITEEHQQNLHSLSSLRPPLQASKMQPSPSISEIAQHKSKFQLREANVDGTRDPHAKKDLLKCFLSSAQLERLERSFHDLAVTKSR